MTCPELHWTPLLHIAILLYIALLLGPLLLHLLARRTLLRPPTYTAKYGQLFLLARSMVAAPHECPSPLAGRLLLQVESAMAVTPCSLVKVIILRIFIDVAYGVAFCYAFAYNLCVHERIYLFLFLFLTRICPVSNLNTRSGNIFESASGYHLLRLECKKKKRHRQFQSVIPIFIGGVSNLNTLSDNT
jgi:hypothetical protein